MTDDEYYFVGQRSYQAHSPFDHRTAKNRHEEFRRFGTHSSTSTRCEQNSERGERSDAEFAIGAHLKVRTLFCRRLWIRRKLFVNHGLPFRNGYLEVVSFADPTSFDEDVT